MKINRKTFTCAYRELFWEIFLIYFVLKYIKIYNVVNSSHKCYKSDGNSVNTLKSYHAITFYLKGVNVKLKMLSKITLNR